MDEDTQSNEDPDVKIEVKLLNKEKCQERLKARRELVKNILEKDPLSGEPWNICAKKSRKVAKGYLQKWKPQMLHLGRSWCEDGCSPRPDRSAAHGGTEVYPGGPAAVRFLDSTCSDEDSEDA